MSTTSSQSEQDDDQDVEMAPSLTPKRKQQAAPMSPKGTAASPRGEDDTFGRPRSWMQYTAADRRSAAAADDRASFSPYNTRGPQSSTRSYHQQQQLPKRNPSSSQNSTTNNNNLMIERTASAASSEPLTPKADFPDPDTMEEDIGVDDEDYGMSLSMPMGSFAEDYDEDDDDESTPKSEAAKSSSSKLPPRRSPMRSPSSTTKTTVYHPFGGPAAYHPPASYFQKSPMYQHRHSAAAEASSATKSSASSTRQPIRRGPPTPSSSSAAPPPPPPYGWPHGYPHYYPAFPPPPHHHYPGAEHPHHPPPQWTSPLPYDDPYGGHHLSGGETPASASSAKQSNAKEAFRSSPPRRSPMPIDGSGSMAATTPEKCKPLLGRSPFRSPPLSQTKGMIGKSPNMMSAFRGSPPHGIGTYGSFGMMDTPGGTLAAEFSPMGPMLHNPFTTADFGDHNSSPPKLPLSRNPSQEDDDNDDDDDHGPAVEPIASPFTGFIHDFNYVPPPPSERAADTAAEGGLEGVPRSPLRSEKRSAAQLASTAPRGERPSLQPVTGSHPNSRRSPAGATSTVLSSPLMGPSSVAKPRKLWNSGPESMRLELGKSSSQTKSLDSINSMMRSQGGKTPASLTSSSAHHPGRSGAGPPQNAYRRLNTPIKLEPSPVQGSKSSAAKSAIKNGSGIKRGYPPSSVKAPPKVARMGGKENFGGGGGGGKRHPCNCKKSKCLKLYCECFSAELFCDGCNCADCKNTAEFSNIREKAMKDTRAKNPNAFKPRIGGKGASVAAVSAQSGHNMGCRCKRSECLKKYCECFQAGVMCGSKCKCKDCMNFAGSQKLIDKRRKIKDQPGAELAMKAADQTWKGQQSARKLPVARPAVHGMRPMPSPVATPGGRMPMANPNMMNPSPSGHPPHPAYHMRPPYMAHPYGHMGYSPMGMHPHMSPAGYGMYPPHPSIPTPLGAKKSSPSANHAWRRPVSMEKATPPAKAASTTDEEDSDEEEEPEKLSPGNTAKLTPTDKSTPTATGQTDKDDDDDASSEDRKPPAGPTPTAKSAVKDEPFDDTVQPTPSERPVLPPKVTPASAVRVAYDPSKNRKKHKVGDAPESTFAFFGDLPKQPKTIALTVFSYLSDSDLTNAAGLVCKSWNRLSKDEALWELQNI